ncbi:MAG TPA: acyl carrier protein [Candidatus Acidoferrales bacterium]|jgi:acyl carrier protein|nr:acyl carrier protein [Candidatus Acidoferrales bacterium]
MGTSVAETPMGGIVNSIETFIRREFRILADDPGFSPDVHLFESGYVDSAGVVELIAFIEATFGVKLEDEHIFDERFTTITGISSVVSGCLTEEGHRGAG